MLPVDLPNFDIDVGDRVNDGRQRLRRIMRKVPTVMCMAMGLLMIAYGLIRVYLIDGFDVIDSKFVTNVIMIAGGIFLTIYWRRSLIRAIGIYAISLGLSRIAIFYDQIQNGNLVTVIPCCILILIAVNLVLTGISFAMGKAVKRKAMMCTTLLMLGFNLVYLTTLVVVAGGIIDLSPTFYVNNIFGAAMYVVLFYLLDSEEVRYGTYDGRHVRYMDRVRNSNRLDHITWIPKDAAEALLDPGNSLWKPLSSGPADAEFAFLIGGKSITAHVIVQIWQNDPRIHFTVHAEQGSIITANRFSADVISREDDQLRIISKDGRDITLKIRGAEPDE